MNNPTLEWELLRFPELEVPELLQEARRFHWFPDEIPSLLFLLKRAIPFKLFDPSHAY